ncbi:sigma-70 family RNA polymerase sigma factor [Georgenia yuyongxinii]|uniref:Sigma-70 family RNA polymerase sigma factor n=1 Tax=Georgenia yuyongxinii TaxID=2589797 RepID=A0A552WTF9_9MICO|nr:sigma-70 family RNA polymerase sigma factor [Georgenia yuyongxinii]
MTPGFASRGQGSLPAGVVLTDVPPGRGVDAASTSDVVTELVVGSRVGDEAEAWPEALATPGPEREAALSALHELMLRAARSQVHRMATRLPGAGAVVLDELTHAAADGALAALLGKLDTFEGRSRFTTWAYKFAILEAATEVRRRAWVGRDVRLDDADLWADPGPGPAEVAEARDLAGAVRVALNEVLTTHQRRVAVALLVEEVPIDVLAERLGTTRGALYKTLHDARGRIRAHLTATGHLLPSQAGAR